MLVNVNRKKLTEVLSQKLNDSNVGNYVFRIKINFSITYRKFFTTISSKGLFILLEYTVQWAPWKIFQVCCWMSFEFYKNKSIIQWLVKFEQKIWNKIQIVRKARFLLATSGVFLAKCECFLHVLFETFRSFWSFRYIHTEKLER